MKLEIKDLFKTYGKKIVLDGFSFSFSEGITAILGPNGAGKTTLMNLICDTVKRESGSICYNGKDILELGDRFRGLLGFMPQEQGMYDNMSAYEFLSYIAELKGLKKIESKKQIPAILESVNLDSSSSSKLGGFSGGMRQRLMLAQALLGTPEVLLLDEPTAGLDPEERIRLREYISDFSKNKITIITTHITSDVQNIAENIILMNKGQIVCATSTSVFISGCGAANLEEAYIKRLHGDE